MKTDYTVMSVKVIGASAKKLGVEVKGDVVSKHRALAEHFKKIAAKGSSLYECTSCGGLSTEDWSKCPYCGGTLDDEEESAPYTTAELQVIAKAAAEESGEIVTTTADLDESVNRIVDRRADAQSSVWELGDAIRDNYDRGLWKLRLKDGKVVYTNWKRFVEAELGMSHTMAFNLMNVAQRFSREDVKALGVSKLSIIAKVEDAAERERLLEGARNGATVRETQAAANGAKEEEPKPGDPVSFMVRTGPVQSFAMKRAEDGEVATRVEVGIWAEELHENNVVSAYSVEQENGLVVLKINRYRG